MFTEEDINSLVDLTDKLGNRLTAIATQYGKLYKEFYGKELCIHVDYDTTLVDEFYHRPKDLQIWMWDQWNEGHWIIELPLNALWSDDWVEKLKAQWLQEIAAKEREKKEDKAAKAVAKEARERKQYERLKAKYEGK